MKYLDCTSGTCTHPEHKLMLLVWGLTAVALLYTFIKYQHDSQNTK